METNEIEIQEQIGEEIANNVIEQYGTAMAFNFPRDSNSNFMDICEGVRITW